MPEVSVIIATHNRAQYLAEAIQSVLDQTYQDFEVVVVDDGSTDNTREVVNGFGSPKIRYIYQKNSGVCAAYNTAIKNSRGRLIAFLDDDDLWLPEKLELQVKALEAAPQAGVIYSDIYNFGYTDPTIPKTHFERLQWPPPRGKVLDKLADRCFPQTSTLVIKQEVFDRVGMFDENLPNCQDYDILMRIADCFDFEVVDRPLAKYRQHANQISRNWESVYRCHIICLDKAVKLSSVDKPTLQKFQAQLAHLHFRYGIILIRKGKLAKSIKELAISAKADPRRFIPAFLNSAKRLVN